ncbi:Sialic acid TRAP transporter permease protein SiaT [Jannaschia aquimarina]|uniref:TRAP transporter small permease protein n=2 Tax=Jannaschia aquimarina TaxID=935700 RepID=A0A0D1EDK6_9RHOB|nr:Sialic acid TRAP transporter permease protein SiaT [Jannaschia aquimarina]SNS62248.1 TRAP-type C4-dicarboxylate transport system, small permease component [Jannaschia aquimarina]
MDEDERDPTGAPEAGRRAEAAGPAWLRRLLAFATAISVALFAGLFVTFVAQVFWRYVLREPLVWTLEVAGILFVAVSLFTAATQMPMREHVALDLLIDALPQRLGDWAKAASLLLFALVMLLSVPDTVRVLEWMYRERTITLKFNLGHLFVLMIAFVLIYAARAVWTALGLIRAGHRD